MNKKNNFIILSLVILALIFRMLLEQFHLDWVLTGAYLSLLTIISTYYGVYSQRHNSDEEFDLMMDFKGGAQGGASFAFGAGFVTYIFYKFIQPHYLDIFIDGRRQLILDRPTENAAIALDNFNEFASMIFVPFNWSVLTIASLTFLSIFYAIVFAIITKFFPKFVNK